MNRVVFSEVIDIYSPDDSFTRMFLKHLEELGYKIENYSQKGYCKWSHIWLNETCEGKNYGNGKARVAVGDLVDEENCKRFRLPEQFYDALYEASKRRIS